MDCTIIFAGAGSEQSDQLQYFLDVEYFFDKQGKRIDGGLLKVRAADSLASFVHRVSSVGGCPSTV